MAIIAKGTRVSNARKSVKVGNGNAERKAREYSGPKASNAVAQNREENAKAVLSDEVRFDFVISDVSLADVKAIAEALRSAKASFNTSPFGEVYGGKAKSMPYQTALVMNYRIERLLDKARRAVGKFETATKKVTSDITA
jgi:hypothetical protein